jgi:hypothetical protein
MLARFTEAATPDDEPLRLSLLELLLARGRLPTMIRKESIVMNFCTAVYFRSSLLATIEIRGWAYRLLLPRYRANLDRFLKCTSIPLPPANSPVRSGPNDVLCVQVATPAADHVAIHVEKFIGWALGRAR